MYISVEDICGSDSYIIAPLDLHTMSIQSSSMFFEVSVELELNL